jgi:hypothetical protein
MFLLAPTRMKLGVAYSRNRLRAAAASYTLPATGARLISSGYQGGHSQQPQIVGRHIRQCFLKIDRGLMSLIRTFSLVVGLFFLSLGPCFLAGCGVSGPLYQPVLSIPPGKGVLYVYHPYRCQSPYNRACEIMINDQSFCTLDSDKYIPVICTPGTLKVGAGWAEEVNDVELQIEPGKASYVMVECHGKVMALGFGPEYATYDVTKKDEAGAKELLADCHMTDSRAGLAEEYWSKPTPGANLSELKTMYIVDEEGKLDTTPCITEELKGRGFAVKSGKLKDMPADTACVVNADEQWMWDMGTYLLGLEIKFANPKTQSLLADAHVRRAWPQARRGAKIMSHEVLNAIFDGTAVKGVEIAPPPVTAAAAAH